MVKRTDSEGEPVRGECKINEAEAAIVRRIFREFAVGKSPCAIATDLNRDRIPGIGRTMYAATDDALLVITPQDKCCLLQCEGHADRSFMDH